MASCEQSNFGDFTVARITDMPEFDVHIVPSAEPPTGMGEPGLPPLAPAFANAIAQLTGKPLRQLALQHRKQELNMSKVWFITGAGSGIGAATARAALKAGDRVVATGRNLDKVRNALSDVAGERLAFVQSTSLRRCRRRPRSSAAIKAFGRIDVLVNNAGYSLLGNFEELSTAEIEQLIATNFYGVMHVMRAVLPACAAATRPDRISVSSLAGIVGFKHCGAYSAAKFAVEGLSASVAPGGRAVRRQDRGGRTRLLPDRPPRCATTPNMPAARSRTTRRKAKPKPCGQAITARSKAIPPSSVTSW